MMATCYSTINSSSPRGDTNLQTSSSSSSIQQLSYSDIHEFGTRNEMMFMTADVNLQVPNPDDHHNSNNNNLHIQGLSLCLGTETTSVPNSFHYQHDRYSEDLMIHIPASTDAVKMNNNGGGGGGHVQANYEQYGYGNVTLLNSKYLKETVDLLDEVVNVKYALATTKAEDQNKCVTSDNVSELSGNNSSFSSSELSQSEKQELQNKKIKLVSMIDEVDTRYKQYYHQMQALVSSLDMAAGDGSAKPYTALALRTISRRFRCLRDAIVGQVDVIRRKVGEQLQGSTANGEGGIPRLRYVEQQLRQQQFGGGGVMRHSWRPQRGLPDNSVSILRAWLFEHFLHPYPNDSEKLELAKQTGLSRNQVANWFINARVRLWKPMVEEMYKKECGGGDHSDINSKSSNDEPNRIHVHLEFPNQLHEAPHRPGRDLQDRAITSPTSTTAAEDHHHFLFHDDQSIIKFHRRSEINHEGLQQYVAEQSPLPFNLNPGDGSLMSAAVQYGGVSLALGLHHNEMDGKPHDNHHGRFGNTVHSMFHDFVASKNPSF